MSIYRISLLFIVLGLAAFNSHANNTQNGCLNYEPETVSLTGTLLRRSAVNVSGQKEVIWVLRLAKPACVNASEGDDFNVKRTRVTDVQLVLEPEMFAKYRGLIGKKSTARGTLFGEHTAHHFTPVLLDVAEMKRVN